MASRAVLENRGIYDVVVVGGGAVGRSVALALARAEQTVLLVYPRAGDESSASLAAGAMIDTFGEVSHDANAPHEADHLTLGRYAQRVYPEWIESIARESEKEIFHRRGMFLVGNLSEDDYDQMIRIKSALREHNEPHDQVHPKEVPGLRTNHRCKAFEAVFMRTALTVDTGDLSSAIGICLANSRFCDVLDDSVRSVEARGNQSEWRVTTAGHGIAAARSVVMCAGAHSLHALGPATRRLLTDVPDLYCGKGISCIAKSNTEFPFAIRTPNRIGACGYHVVPRADQQVYLGATNSLWLDVDAAAEGGVQLGHVSDLIRACAHQVSTSLQYATMKGARYGLRPTSADGAPMIGQTRLSGLYIAAGTYRTGVHLAPTIADLITSEILGRPAPIEHSFAPRDRELPEPRRALGRALHGVVDHLLHEGATLYDRDQELDVFVTRIFEMAVFGAHPELLRKIRELHGKVANLDEAITARLYREILSYQPSAEA